MKFSTTRQPQEKKIAQQYLSSSRLKTPETEHANATPQTSCSRANLAVKTDFGLPELLSPAGDEESIHAAIENGADAVYFGIAGIGKYNARVRAKNIPRENLKNIMQLLHSRAMSGYVALNTLAYDDELAEIEQLIREIAQAGVDAIIVQDIGLAVLAKRFCPNLPIHASTQMSLTSPLSIKLASSLGLKRIVLPRELSLQQIREIRKTTDCEIEVFVHGSLCISFSGQCYASLSLGGRSANRGCCAQPCRIPYSLIGNNCTNNPAQILSPCDLAALPILEQLTAAGVNSLKIEGRLKPAKYVAETTRIYRETLDYIEQKIENNTIHEDLVRLEMIFSRGFTTGWLDKVEPRLLVLGNVMSHRGVEIGKVIEMRRDAVVVRLSSKVQRGDGILFENNEQPNNSQGGRVYEIMRNGESVQKCTENVKVLLTFANNSIDPQYVTAGQSVRKTNDPELEREIRKSLESKNTSRRVPINIEITAVAGKPIKISAESLTGAMCEIVGKDNLEVAVKHPITLEMLSTQFSRLGDTIFSLGKIKAEIQGNPMIPLSLLGKLRHELIDKLENYSPQSKNKIEFHDNLETIKRNIHNSFSQIYVTKNKEKIGEKIPTTIHLLLREIGIFEDEELLKRIIALGCKSFYGEFGSIAEYRFASQVVRGNGASFVAVLPRVILPLEDWKADKFLELKPDAVLARNCGELLFFNECNIPVIADFSFNVINELSFQKLLEWGVERVTPGFDLSEEQTVSFCESVPKSAVELIVFGRVPLFTINHCLWRANIIPQGKPCGQICKQVPLKIEDRRGAIHSVRPDILCKNIIENAAEYSIKPINGIEHIRIEWDSRLGNLLRTIEKFSQTGISKN
ncbi:MAG: U32 family peptidase [Planctomycetaceae bacterium]|nr:U32 family peptidase [Planctomycetaceae bacterium]